MKANTVKRTPAQLRKREQTLLEELCMYHGYSFSDTLPDRDRTTMLMSKKNGRTKLEMGRVLKVIVPGASKLATLATADRHLRENARKGKRK